MSFVYLLKKKKLTGHVDGTRDETILSELPGLPDVYDCGCSASQKLLQLLVCHICALWRCTEPADLQHCCKTHTQSAHKSLRITIHVHTRQKYAWWLALRRRLTFPARVSLDVTGHKASTCRVGRPRKDSAANVPQEPRNSPRKPSTATKIHY